MSSQKTKMVKVICADCSFYKFTEGVTDEPLGGCENDDVLMDVCRLDYMGTNWRLNHRFSRTPRYCKGFNKRSEAENQ